MRFTVLRKSVNIPILTQEWIAEGIGDVWVLDHCHEELLQYHLRAGTVVLQNHTHLHKLNCSECGLSRLTL